MNRSSGALVSDLLARIEKVEKEANTSGALASDLLARIDKMEKEANSSSALVSDLLARIEKLESEAMNRSYAQLERFNGQIFAANSWTAVIFVRVAVSYGIKFSGANINFTSTGEYRATLGFRPGTGDDFWMGVRVFGDGTSRGHSNGFGQTDLNDPAQFLVSFFFTITKLI